MFHLHGQFRFEADLFFFPDIESGNFPVKFDA